MNKAMLTVGLIMLSMIALFVINVVQSYATGSELDYYLLKETTEASMVDALEEETFRTSGQIRMDKEKFVESFIKRFAQEVEKNRDYTIGFYDINEVPPKVSVMIDSGTMYSFVKTGNRESSKLPISTKITMILTSNNPTNTPAAEWNKTCSWKTGVHTSCFNSQASN